ncbi:hypothetical protein ANO11243_075850 [Dothideomycetidae sp. 11243]|nr:hypothetical protein ANO11243_075850 [fungal sp. No.11243]
MYTISSILTILCSAHIGSALPSGYSRDICVQPGQSIQKAIDAAKPGTQITVEPGTYAEQLTINKDGICLIGNGAILVPPASPVTNTCAGLVGGTTNAGICVEGTGIVFAGPFVQEHRIITSVATPVKDVSISGFTVQGFDGLNIAVIGADSACIDGNTLINGPSYGVLTHYSTSSSVTANKVVSEDILRGIGICTNDTSPSQVRRNQVSGYGVGLCVQTTGGHYVNNQVNNACAGIFVDPGISAKVLRNNIGANNATCLSSFHFAAGIFLYGAQDTIVRRNTVHDQHASGQALGIAVFDASTLNPPVVASNNIVRHNTLVNDDVDLFVNSAGTGNVIEQNSCDMSSPLCSQ